VDLAPRRDARLELQQGLVMLGMIAGDRRRPRHAVETTYSAASPSARSYRLRHADADQHRDHAPDLRSGFVYDFHLDLPFSSFFPWAAATAPASTIADSTDADDES